MQDKDLLASADTLDRTARHIAGADDAACRKRVALHEAAELLRRAYHKLKEAGL